MKKISIILPCLNESKNLPFLIPNVIKQVPKKYAYEIICVDDGSTDFTFETIKKLASKNHNVKGLIFHRNFGHQAALLAGINIASGDAIITMDADFQHPPEMLPIIIKEWEKGHDVVHLKKKEDMNGKILFRSVRKIGYWIWKSISNGLLIPGVSDFRLIDNNIKQYLVDSEESEVFLRGIVNLAGRNPIYLSYTVGQRKFGKSSYTMRMFLHMFLNGFMSFSIKPLRLATFFGLAIALVTAILLGYDIFIAILTGKRVIEGWMTVVLLLLILNGFIIFYLGIMGEYLGVIFKEVKNRPKYVIGRKINL